MPSEKTVTAYRTQSGRERLHRVSAGRPESGVAVGVAARVVVRLIGRRGVGLPAPGDVGGLLRAGCPPRPPRPRPAPERSSGRARPGRSAEPRPRAAGPGPEPAGSGAVGGSVRGASSGNGRRAGSRSSVTCSALAVNAAFSRCFGPRVHRASPSIVSSLSRPLLAFDFTAPREMPSAWAISASDRLGPVTQHEYLSLPGRQLPDGGQHLLVLGGQQHFAVGRGGVLEPGQAQVPPGGLALAQYRPGGVDDGGAQVAQRPPPVPAAGPGAGAAWRRRRAPRPRRCPCRRPAAPPSGSATAGRRRRGRQDRVRPLRSLYCPFLAGTTRPSPRANYVRVSDALERERLLLISYPAGSLFGCDRIRG